MAKDPKSQRRRGLHILNDRLLALKNLVRVRNEEITMEFSKETTTDEDPPAPEELQDEVDDEKSPPRDSTESSDPDTDKEVDGSGQDNADEIAGPEEESAAQVDHVTDSDGTQDTPGVQEPTLMPVPEFTDLDELPVLTERISTGPLHTTADSDVIAERQADEYQAGEQQQVATSVATLSRQDLENIAVSILDIIDEQISYANLPHSTSTDREALKRAIADLLASHQIVS